VRASNRFEAHQPRQFYRLGVTVSGPGQNRSGPDEAGDRLGGFLDLGVAFGAAEPGGVCDAVFEVVVEKAEGDTFQGGGEGGDLGEDVDAVLLLGLSDERWI